MLLQELTCYLMRPETENPTWNYPTLTPDTWIKLVNDITSPSRVPITRQSLLFPLVLLQYRQEQSFLGFLADVDRSWRGATSNANADS